MTDRKALLVGIDDYHTFPLLIGCVRDAEEMRKALERNHDGSRNYECRSLPSKEANQITRTVLRTQWLELFNGFRGKILFYFSGHGLFTRFGGYLVTQEGIPADPGLAMNELLQLANESEAQEVLLIIDCCNSGAVGDPSNIQGRFGVANQTQLREGVTILVASRSNENAISIKGGSVFTNLVLGALDGGAADVRGHVSAASVYSYVEQSLGAFDQRPLYKSYANQLSPIRYCKPDVEDELLRKLPEYFKEADHLYQLDPTYEYTRPENIKAHVDIFKIFKKYRNARLLMTVEHEDLYDTAINSYHVALTPLGKFYRRLVIDGRI